MLNFGIIFAYVALILWAVDDVILKGITVKVGTFKVGIFALAFGIIPTALIVALPSPGSLNFVSLLFSFAAGIFLGIGYLLQYKSFETEQVTNTMALSEVQTAIIALFGIFVLNEGINSIQGLGILIIFIGAFFVGVNGRIRFNRKLIPALLANISFAFYWISFTYGVYSYSGFPFPLFFSRAIAFLAVIMVSLLYGGKNNHAGRSNNKVVPYIVGLLAIIGVMDGIGNLAFGYVAFSNMIAIGGAIASLSPVLIAVLGKIVYNDKLLKIQLFGLVIAVAGAVILNIA